MPSLKTVFFTTQKKEYVAQLIYERDARHGRGYYALAHAVEVEELSSGLGYSFTMDAWDGTSRRALLVPVSRASDRAEHEAARMFPAWCEAYFKARGESADQCTAAEAAGMRARRMEREEAEGAAKTA